MPCTTHDPRVPAVPCLPGRAPDEPHTTRRVLLDRRTTPMKHLLLTGDRNTGADNDFTGAFEPESLRYAAFWRARGDVVDLVRVDLSERSPGRVAQMVAALTRSKPIDRFAVCCHGWQTGMQLGLSSDTPEALDALAAFATTLAACSSTALRVALYCCSTGASDAANGVGSFADRLRFSLVAAGRPAVTIFAHRTAGHTTRNAAVRIFGPRMTGGVDLGTTRESRARLDARLHDGSDPLRWTLPYEAIDDARKAFP